MAKDQVKLQSFPAQSSTRKRLWVPIAALAVSGFALYWTASHVAGNCTDTLQDIVTFCPLR